MPFKGGRKGSYYPEGQSRKGGGLCHNHPEVNRVDSSTEVCVTPVTLPSSCPFQTPSPRLTQFPYQKPDSSALPCWMPTEADYEQP